MSKRQRSGSVDETAQDDDKDAHDGEDLELEVGLGPQVRREGSKSNEQRSPGLRSLINWWSSWTWPSVGFGRRRDGG